MKNPTLLTQHTKIRAERIVIKGVVQGVGFRPFIYRLASNYNIRGFIQNDANGVLIEVEGEDREIDDFINSIRLKAPPLSRIEDIICEEHPAVGYVGFSIRESGFDDKKNALVSPDVATCPECLSEFFDPSDRRYGYPFINCTNCGPRFTIIRDVPYDRPNTTMARFIMCKRCKNEYEKPQDRRFHAQPNACPECGPRVELVQSSEFIVHSKDGEAIKETGKLLKDGKVVGIKGLGGFHLACDALNRNAVETLRKRKSRDKKPFALMAKDVDVIRDYCAVSPDEERALQSPRRPIVLLEKNKDIEGVAPGNRHIGFMLPYTPLHHLLFNLPASLPLLVMTSGNRTDEPISYKNKEALEHIGGIADYFLLHNREIHARCDDSVVRIFEGEEILIRRSRGYVPEPIDMPFSSDRAILACGAGLKNTFCLTKGSYAFPSHHIGDLENLETLTAFEEGIEHFKHLFSINPTVIAYDLHPEYLSTKYALKTQMSADNQCKKSGVISVGVQHHHAHIASCMVDNGLNKKVIGVALDGLGYGTDGNFWGCEFLIADYLSFERMFHLQYVPMPGGEAAIREPWRMTACYLWHIYGDEFLNLGIEFAECLEGRKWGILKKMIENGVNSPLTSSMGRLFDAVSSLLGICRFSSYEGQAAIELEGVASSDCDSFYDYELKKDIIIPDRIFCGIIEDLKNNIPVDIISCKFHRTIGRAVVDVCKIIRDRTDIWDVALSGGVFQNMLLLRDVVTKLRDEGFKVYIPHSVPLNDGGISLGQAAIAISKCKNINTNATN